jgi:hypothetical protein
MIPRSLQSPAAALFKQYPVITITGSRQSGKTTLARAGFDLPYTNLEALDQREFAQSDPKGFLASYPKGVIIDEIQRVPELTSYIQVIVDEQQVNGRYVLTGSQNFSIREALSQTLAGRSALLTLLPFSLPELSTGKFPESRNTLHLYRGFYPRIFSETLNPAVFYRDYVATYVERDLRQLSMIKDIGQFQTFMRLCASNIGQILNLNRIANDCGISQTTATEWLSLLEASYIVTRLQPFHSNTRKRLVKRPKLYFYDTGIASFLLGITEEGYVDAHPLKGALFENLVVIEVMKFFFNRNDPVMISFYRDSDGNEIDLLISKGPHLLPIEIKYGKTINKDFFKMFKRLGAGTDLHDFPYGKLIVYGGDESQQRSDGTQVLPVCDLHAYLSKTFG